MWTRRRFIRNVLGGVGSISLLASAGCTSTSDDPENPTTQNSSGPNPVIEESKVPDPVVVSTDYENNPRTYTATIENEGGDGRVGVEFVWTNGEVTDGKPDKTFEADSVERQTIELGSGEQQTVTVSPDSIPDDDYGYWFSVVPRSVYVSFRNEGESGDVTVSLVSLTNNTEQVVATETTHVQSESMGEVTLEFDDVTIDGDAQLRIDFSVP